MRRSASRRAAATSWPARQTTASSSGTWPTAPRPPRSLVRAASKMHANHGAPGHNDLVGPIKFNPRHMSFASADTSLALWIPTIAGV